MKLGKRVFWGVFLSGLIIATILCFGLVFPGVSSAADFPTKNIKILIPFAPGGGLDISCRVMASAVTKENFNGKKLIIECMPGGGGVIGTTNVKKEPADGYTVLCMTTSVISNPMLKEGITFTHQDFRPIAMFSFEPELLIARKDAPFKTLKEFFVYAQNNEVKLSTPGHSTSHHMAGLKMAMGENLKIVYLHNSAAPEQLAQIMGGHADVALLASGEGAGSVLDGTVIALGTMNETRLGALPDVPTFKELGYDYVDGALRGLAVRKETPDEIVNILAENFRQILTSEACKNGMEKANSPLVYNGPDGFQDYIDKTYANLQEIVPLLKNSK
jgi:tripartite-type tricarboxylate transporter receptor subunit TctC